MIYVFDLDGTICLPTEHPDSLRRYRQAQPIPAVVSKMMELQRAGHVIIIHTARRMLTHAGDVAAVIADVGDITREWLAENQVPYDALVFGKPYGDFYVDDKGLSIHDLLTGP